MDAVLHDQGEGLVPKVQISGTVSARRLRQNLEVMEHHVAEMEKLEPLLMEFFEDRVLRVCINQ